MTVSVTVHADDGAALDLLQGYEWQLAEDRLADLGPDAYRSFLRIAEDNTQVNFIRARAVTTLTRFPNEEVWAYFESSIRGEQEFGSQQKVQRRQIVQGICSSFLASRPEQVGEVLVPLLEVNDVHLRTRSARCLQSVSGVRVESALTDYRSKISESWELKAAGFSKEVLQ